MPEEMDDIRIAADLLSVLPTVVDEIDSMTNKVLRQAYQAIASKTLTPDLAQAYFMELYSYRQLRVKFESRAEVASNTLTNSRKGDN